MGRSRFAPIWRWIARLALLLVAAAAVTARAEPAGPDGAIRLSACVTPARPGDQVTRLFANPQRFDCQREQSSYGPGDYWVLIPLPDTPAAQTEEMAPLFAFQPSWQARATLYSRDRTGMVVARSLDNYDLSRFGRVGGQSAVPLTGHEAPVNAVLLRIEGALNASGLIQVPMLLSESAADRIQLSEVAIYAAFAGVTLALMAYNLLLWGALRERFQLLYSGTLGAMLVYAAAHSGAIDLAFPALGAETRFRIAYLALGMIGASAMQFLVACIEPGMLKRSTVRTFHAASLFVVAAAVTVSVVPDSWAWVADRIYVVSFVPIPILSVYAAAQAIRAGSQIARLLALAWAFPVAMAVIRIAHAANLIGYSIWVEHSAIVALGIEALLSALAMAWRFKRIARERDLARAEERVARQLAEIDPLTGLSNRRALLSGALNWGNDEPLRLVLVDIDHFKAINDTYGHDLGDEVLRAVAGELAAHAQIRATVARLGGEEFALLGTSTELTTAVVGELLERIRNHPMPHGETVTISIGMAEGTIASETDWRALYRRADQALYAAKHRGRNCLVESSASGAEHKQQQAVAVA